MGTYDTSIPTYIILVKAAHITSKTITKPVTNINCITSQHRIYSENLVLHYVHMAAEIHTVFSKTTHYL